MKHAALETTHGTIAYRESRSDGDCVLMVHGNSSCKEVFRNQYEGELGRRFRCIAIDLPGHGSSADALDPERTYSMPGYADAVIEFLARMNIDSYVVLGWSLGGHIGIEMIPDAHGMRGLMISGTPPVGRGAEEVARGFVATPHMHLAAQEHLSKREVDAYAHATCGVNAPYEAFLGQAVARTDGRARRLMFEKFTAGTNLDELAVAIGAPMPLAIVNGASDPFLNHEHVRNQPYGSLWNDTVVELEDVGHAPFWEAPNLFDRYLLNFLQYCFRTQAGSKQDMSMHLESGE